MDLSWKRRISFIVSIVLLGILLALVDAQSVVRVLKGAEVRWLLLALVVFYLTYLPLARRWKVLLGALSYAPSTWECIQMVAMSYGLNKLLPANSGDIVRSKIVEQYMHVDNHSAVLGMVALERATDLATLSMFLVVGTFLLPTDTIQQTRILGGAIFFVVVVGVVLGTIARARNRVIAGFPENIQKLVRNLVFGSQYLTVDSSVRIGFYAVTRWGLAISTLLPLALALGVQIDLSVAVVTICVMSLVTALPLTPGGIGPAETAGTSVLVMSGLQMSEALSLVLLQRTLVLVGMGLTGVAVYQYSNVLTRLGSS